MTYLLLPVHVVLEVLPNVPDLKRKYDERSLSNTAQVSEVLSWPSWWWLYVSGKFEGKQGTFALSTDFFMHGLARTGECRRCSRRMGEI